MMPRGNRHTGEGADERFVQTRPASTAPDHHQVSPVLVEPVELHDQRPRLTPVLVRSGQPRPRERGMLLAQDPLRMTRWPAIRLRRVHAQQARFRAPLQAELERIQQVHRVTIGRAVRPRRCSQPVHWPPPVPRAAMP